MENINPYVFISKKMREIITNISPKISLNKKPPHRTTMKALSDLAIEILISQSPIEKLRAVIRNPIIIDMKSI